MSMRFSVNVEEVVNETIRVNIRDVEQAQEFMVKVY